MTHCCAIPSLFFRRLGDIDKDMLQVEIIYLLDIFIRIQMEEA
jgi:hypothetical protein